MLGHGDGKLLCTNNATERSREVPFTSGTSESLCGATSYIIFTLNKRAFRTHSRLQMTDRDPCEICQLPDQQWDSCGTRWMRRISCARCGHYELDTTALPSRQGRTARQVRLSGFIREQNAAGIVPRITITLARRLECMPLPRLKARALRALSGMVQDVGFNVQQQFAFNKVVAIQAAAYCADAEELWTLIQILDHLGLVETQGAGTARITPSGLLAAEELSLTGADSSQGFVAMSFSAEMNEAYTFGFDAAIRAAGYSPLRIDNKEHVGGITDEIMAEIRRSRFVVADYTEQKNGVYFEAGFAAGLGLTVIQTCRGTDIEKLHFDIRHINTLVWNNPSQLADALEKRISAVVGDGPLRSTHLR